ncbi:MAG: Cj0069 family protein [Chitinophagaceae bacterium]|nr:Cj0069 family protein [Chitinophagaceae bacterium]
MKSKSIAIMIYGEPGSTRNALTEEKYKNLAAHLAQKGFLVDSVVYNDSVAGNYKKVLLKYKAILVWVNPIEQENDRTILDNLLRKLSEKGCFVSAHPDTILKMGTKEVLYSIRDTELGGDIHLYHSVEDFIERFVKKIKAPRILKQYRGNGGDGVFKVEKNNEIIVTHAKGGRVETFTSDSDLIKMFSPYFSSNGMLIDQPWNSNIINGMVRCYLCANKVTGFGYQEINALYPGKRPGQRFYFSEDCGLFQDLRQKMEDSWINSIQASTQVTDELLPVIWDADFFINDVNNANTKEKYSLCEINVSCVSPFPESSIPYIARYLEKKIK